ncbi:MAG: hypothetical protein FJX00_01945 [Alphaproteobacteria bacterium]|nr:hypothetical protein [Alphaproteobacteria bacterium]
MMAPNQVIEGGSVIEEVAPAPTTVIEEDYPETIVIKKDAEHTKKKHHKHYADHEASTDDDSNENNETTENTDTGHTPPVVIQNITVAPPKLTPEMMSKAPSESSVSPSETAIPAA